MAAKGFRVLALDQDIAGLEELARGDSRITIAAVDVTDSSSVSNLLGGTAWDHVVAAAGIGYTGRIDATSIDVHSRLMAVNYLGTVHTVKAVLPAMIAADRGRITIFASIAGWVPAPEHGPYGATKAALVNWSQALAAELDRSHVEVTCVCPSAVATPLLDAMPAAKRGERYLAPAEPDHVVDAVLKAMEHGRPWVFPREAKTLQLFQRFTPHLMQRGIRYMLKDHTSHSGPATYRRRQL